MGSTRCFNRRTSIESYTSVLNGEVSSHKWPLWKKILIISGIVLLCIIFLLFIAIWVVLPIVFMCSVAFERFVIFLNINNPKNPQFDKPEKYSMNGVVNFYMTTLDVDNSSLVNIGAWMIIPNGELNATYDKSHTREAAANILANTKYPILVYMHGVACNRILPISTYNVARKYFLVIAVDHRGYGDSGPNAVLSKRGLVSDSVQIYQWIRSKTNNDIYVWGHSLGTAIGTHTVRSLREQNIVPKGLILESSFTTTKDVVCNNPIGKVFSWLVYFKQTVLDPLERNDFTFFTTTNILHVDCPIMIMHAEDDNVIPYALGKKVYEVAINQRNLTIQGNVTFHLFPAVGYYHVGITNDPKIPQYIEDFMAVCKRENKAQG